MMQGVSSVDQRWCGWATWAPKRWQMSWNPSLCNLVVATAWIKIRFATGGWKMQQPGGSGAAKVWGCYSAPFARPSQITQDLLKNPCDLRFVHVSTCFSQRFPRFLVHKGRCWWSQWTAPRQRSPMVNPLEGISPEPRCSQDWSGFWWNWGHPFRKKGWDSMGARG
jgi:hypothetical protein